MSRSDVRRLTWVLFLSQCLGSAGYIAGNTIGPIIGEKLSGQTALAGLPGFVYLLGSALAAFPAARFMEESGRRPGLALGFGLGCLGSLLAGWAVLTYSFGPFLAAVALVGAANGVTNLARYGAAEMHPLAKRGRAISLVVLGGTVGAIAGPALVKPMGVFAQSFRADPLAGPWLASAALLAAGVALMLVWLRPDPRDVGRQLPPEPGDSAPAGPIRTVGTVLAQPGAQVAVAALIVGQLVMVMLMAITSVHMTHHQHDLGDVSLVIMAHTLGMYGLSLVSGRLSDRFGRGQTIIAGAGILIAACLLAPQSQNTLVIAAALFLLGLGWNFCYVAGAALLTDTLTVAERNRWQGGIDLLMNLVSAVGSIGSGLIFAALGYALMAWISLAATLLPLGLAAAYLLRRSASLPTANHGG